MRIRGAAVGWGGGPHGDNYKGCCSCVGLHWEKGCSLTQWANCVSNQLVLVIRGRAATADTAADDGFQHALKKPLCLALLLCVFWGDLWKWHKINNLMLKCKTTKMKNAFGVWQTYRDVCYSWLSRHSLHGNHTGSGRRGWSSSKSKMRKNLQLNQPIHQSWLKDHKMVAWKSRPRSRKL